jgi:hypothetical protein
LRRRLWLVNGLLLVLLVAGSVEIHRGWVASEARKKALFAQTSSVTAPPAPAIGPAPPPLNAAPYLEVASQLLLSKDRNPTVVVEVEAPKVPPPYPRFYGAMDLGDGVRVVLSEKPGSSQKSYKIGDSIGPFRILAVSRAGIDFEWEGQRLVAKMAELKDATPAIQEAPPPSPAAETPRQASVTVIGGNPTKPGVDIGEDKKGCQAGDASPAGTVTDGYRKVVVQSPFGGSCWWERVR